MGKERKENTMVALLDTKDLAVAKVPVTNKMEVVPDIQTLELAALGKTETAAVAAPVSDTFVAKDVAGLVQKVGCNSVVPEVEGVGFGWSHLVEIDFWK